MDEERFFSETEGLRNRQRMWKDNSDRGDSSGFQQRGISLAPYKCGPDYIDPMFHREITGNVSVNLDGVFLSPEKMREIFAWHMEGKQAAVIEGVMGYYDGQGRQRQSQQL